MRTLRALCVAIATMLMIIQVCNHMGTPAWITAIVLFLLGFGWPLSWPWEEK